jgi:hypothetical protein
VQNICIALVIFIYRGRLSYYFRLMMLLNNWVVSLSCQRLTELGCVGETRVSYSLVKHISSYADRKEHFATDQGYEYKRLRTVSLLEGVDFSSGEFHPLVKDQYRSFEFVGFFDMIDGMYPKKWGSRIFLDNHFDHVSKETQQYLKSQINWFHCLSADLHYSDRFFV